MLDLAPIKRRVEAVGNEPLSWGPQGEYYAIGIYRDGSFNHDLLAMRSKHAMRYAILFSEARDTIRDLITEVERLRNEVVGLDKDILHMINENML